VARALPAWHTLAYGSSVAVGRRLTSAERTPRAV
jgi:hypothetical protein